MPLAVKELLNERYQIVRAIKEGGMGAVYEARDTKLANSPCAVKEILESVRLGKDSEYVQRSFAAEMGQLASLDHPSIPKVRDYLKQDSTIYIVMDLIHGQSLEEEIEETVGLTGFPAPPEKSVKDILALLDTLAYLHGHQPPIVHRDIKPANVLRDRRNGQIKLVDFGLARRLDATAGQTMVGTLGYCAPEQLMGKAEKASDLYSVGVTLHQMLTGHRPDMINLEALRPELPGVRPGLEIIVEKATQPRPSQRYANSQAMAADLRAWLEASPQQAQDPLICTPSGPTATMPKLEVASPPGSSSPTDSASTTDTSGQTNQIPPRLSFTRAAAAVTVLAGALAVGLMLGRSTAAAPSPSPTLVLDSVVATPPQQAPGPPPLASQGTPRTAPTQAPSRTVRTQPPPPPPVVKPQPPAPPPRAVHLAPPPEPVKIPHLPGQDYPSAPPVSPPPGAVSQAPQVFVRAHPLLPDQLGENQARRANRKRRQQHGRIKLRKADDYNRDS